MLTLAIISRQIANSFGLITFILIFLLLSFFLFWWYFGVLSSFIGLLFDSTMPTNIFEFYCHRLAIFRARESSIYVALSVCLSSKNFEKLKNEVLWFHGGPSSISAVAKLTYLIVSGCFDLFCSPFGFFEEIELNQAQ